MDTPLKIGIVGCGAIGSSIAKAVKRDFKGLAEVVALFDLAPHQAARLSRRIYGSNTLAASNLAALITRSQLVVESASAQSSWKIARAALSKGKSILIMSVGGILPHYTQMYALASRSRARVYIPSGAICGIDALKAARMGKIKSVTLTTYKNPRSLKGVISVAGKNCHLDGIKKDKILFCGSAQDAVQYFPKNINVAAVLSLAGIGAEKTRVKIIASPSVKRNIHQVRIDAESGIVVARTENLLHPDNPKTSFLAVLSAVAVLKSIVDPVRIGT
ncbi:MAG: DUF108 domain-containing protein [Candidatus Omnitrophica bacterium]|nr:DUF108 domain-containing protein [Candidatus Omnitrophota bacterium]